MKIIQTSDGSHTLYLEEMDETYHSRHGAIQESRHVFLKNGFRHGISSWSEKEISIFEIGFGTGLNALLTAIDALKYRKSINYTTIEPCPISSSILYELNYKNHIPTAGAGTLLNAIHEAEWESRQRIHEYFYLRKRKVKYQDFTPADNHYHLIYYDAFAPNKQPEMWNLELIDKAHRSLKNRGFLVTYCAQGQFKRNLAACGFEVTTLPGPPGKKEMIRAIKVDHSS